MREGSLKQVSLRHGGSADLHATNSHMHACNLQILQSILQKEFRHVVTLALKCPKLVTTDMTSARQAFYGLSRMLALDQGTVYAMVCHAPELLTQQLPRLTQRHRRLQRALGLCPAWEEQWRRLSPARRADCLTCTVSTYLRLEFLLVSNQVRHGAMSGA